MSTSQKRIGMQIRQKKCVFKHTEVEPKKSGGNVVDSGASMHMLSRKDLNSAELDTVRISRNLQRLSQPVEKWKQMRKQQCTSTAWSSSSRYKPLRTQSCRWELRISRIFLSGPVVKNHIKPKMAGMSSKFDYKYIFYIVTAGHVCDSTSIRASGNRLREQRKKGTSYRDRETSCEMCQNGWRISQKIQWTEECQHQVSRDTPANTSHGSD